MNSSTVLAIVRIITGLLLAYHGLELFDEKKMVEYAAWPNISALPLHELMVYLAKAIELFCGAALAIGWFTKVAAVANAIVMLFICFYIGSGQFWYQDQHPFLLAMLCSIYAFGGAGKWSVNEWFFRRAKNKQPVAHSSPPNASS